MSLQEEAIEALSRVLVLADAYAPVESEDALISPNQIRRAVASPLRAEERTIMTPRTAPYESFEEWHDDGCDECPLCNPHACDDYCHNCEEAK